MEEFDITRSFSKILKFRTQLKKQIYAGHYIKILWILKLYKRVIKINMYMNYTCEIIQAYVRDNFLH